MKIPLILLSFFVLGSTMPAADAVPQPMKRAEGSPFAAPSFGFVWEESSRSLRPLVGTPATAALGAPIDLGFAPAQLSLAAGRAYAIAFDLDGQQWVVWKSNGSVDRELLETLPAALGKVAFSPDQTRAAIVIAGTVYQLDGLPDQPQLRTVATGSSLRPDHIALSDSGLLVASAGDGVLQTVDRDGWGPWVDTGLAQISAFSFVPGSDDLVVADAIGQTIARVGGSAVTPLATAEDGITSPAVVAVVGDRALVQQQDGTLLSVALDGSGVAAVGCDCEVGQLTLVSRGSLFWVSRAGSSPGWLLDATAAQSQFLFVRTGQGGGTN